MEQMRKENEEMIAEAARMRQEYARSVLLNHEPSIQRMLHELRTGIMMKTLRSS